MTYEVRCVKCGDFYIGETVRNAYEITKLQRKHEQFRAHDWKVIILIIYSDVIAKIAETYTNIVSIQF